MSELISAIYGCAMQPGQWQAVLGEMLDWLGGKGAMLWSHQARPGAFGLWVPCRMHPESLAEYGRYYHRKDIWLQAGYARNTQAGEILTGDMLVPRPVLSKSEFYRDFLRRFDYVQLLIGVLHRNDAHDAIVPTVHFSMYRGEADKAFSQRDHKRLRELLPHLQHATAVNFHLAQRDHQLSIAQASVDLFPEALFFADLHGQIVYANRAAHELLQRADGVRMLDGRLVTLNAEEQRVLTKLFDLTAPPALLRISRCDGKAPYLAMRSRVTPQTHTPDERYPVQAILIHDPEAIVRERIESVVARYELTAAECIVLNALLETGSARGVAQRLNLSDNTVKTHLKSIFGKTGVHRQAELVNLVLSFPARVQL
ncbi:MAG: helix-turn-helix transcriptional regulator [Thiobacillus sp.]|nr:helix-turn-helix transcriptional regulator [Thiobacillus sp.]